MPVTWDDLCGYRLNCEVQFRRNMRFDLGIDIGKCSHSARNRTGRNLSARRDQALASTRKFGIGLGELQPEGNRFGMDAVAAANRRRKFMLQRAGFDRGKQLVHIGNQQVGGARQLHSKAGVEHVGGRHALVHETRFITDLLGNPSQESNHVMLGHCLDRVNRRDINLGVGCPPFPKRLCRRFRYHTQICQSIGCVCLNLEPNPEPRLRLPDGDHIGARIAGDHGRTFYKAWSRSGG